MRRRSERTTLLAVMALTISIISLAIAVPLISGSSEQQAIKALVECYESSNQCGLHNLLEEGDLEDVNIAQAIVTLEANELGLEQSTVEELLEALDYMKTLNITERFSLISKVHELHTRRVNP
jgi:hypothetical protein